MNNSSFETNTPTPVSPSEQALLDRQYFVREQDARDERQSYRLLNLLAPSVDKEFSWVRTDDPSARAELARGMLEIKQQQQAALLEKGEYPTGPETYRALQYRYQVENVGKAVLLAQALMGGDIRKGTLPILSDEINRSL